MKHVAIQLIVALITVNILWDEPDAIQPGRLGAWLVYFLQIDLIICVNMYVLVPLLLIKHRIGWYVPALLALIIFSVMGIGMLQDSTMDNEENSQTWLQALASFSAFGLFITGLTTGQLSLYRFENLRRIDELENVTMSIELANLQNQINPHFLFNMLNNANIMAGEDAGKSSHILLKLKDLVRYQVEAGGKKAVRLANEISFLRDYLELEKLRRDSFAFTIRAEGNMEADVPPLLFIPFVENAVKHNPESGSYVDIRFRREGGTLRFECRNPKTTQAFKAKGGGIGLANVKRRLDLLFGKDYSLSLPDRKDVYSVIMELKV